jgi:TolB protein
MQGDGSHARQLTGGTDFIFHPSACPDGRTVVFDSWAESDGIHSIWRVDTDGTNIRRLTFGRAGMGPSCSPDGQWAIFDSRGSDTGTLWKVPIGGGSPIQLTDYASNSPAISPDGKWIACFYLPDPAQSDKRKIAIVPFEGGRPAKIIDFQRAAKASWLLDSGLKWTPDGRALAYLDLRKGVLNIWSQPLDGSPPKPLTNFDRSGQVWSFAWSRDGKQLAMARGAIKSDVVLIDNSK